MEGIHLDFVVPWLAIDLAVAAIFMLIGYRAGCRLGRRSRPRQANGRFKRKTHEQVVAEMADGSDPS